jgi:hypothetical protein
MFDLIMEADLQNGEKISTPDITSNKPKVVRVTYKQIPIRVKISKNGAIGCRDTNECFLKAFFPRHFDDYLSNQDALRPVVSELRIRMELRSFLMDSALANPQEIIAYLREEDK